MSGFLLVGSLTRHTWLRPVGEPKTGLVAIYLVALPSVTGLAPVLYPNTAVVHLWKLFRHWW
ncbi:hypothetical protein SAMD00023353_0701080 [Rosellinia necatrix]|uniref:Uncharacterized protein n=1 Tax=Rosellinia necatrix TaxID=77044 RepID=A0A1S8A5V3_ROSNE|nr:hypothetical protein SAMD00023353_0701080 [Rosellinia necatrix]